MNKNRQQQMAVHDPKAFILPLKQLTVWSEDSVSDGGHVRARARRAGQPCG